MLVLKRKEGQWIEVVHAASGDMLRIRVYNIRDRDPKQVDLAFDDDARNFNINRPERKPRPDGGPPAEPRRYDPDDVPTAVIDRSQVQSKPGYKIY